jgi:DNA replication and repair protein RecF
LKNEHGFSHSYLEEFDRPLIQTGANLTQERLRWIHRINLPLKEAVKRIAKNQADISLNYRSNWAFSDSFPGLIEPISLEILETNFRKNLLQQRAVEQRLKSTIVGPHRDDWEISLGAAPLKSFGSQGEIRSVLLGMKICEIESFQTTTQQLPVFLLDDLSSELDQWRRKQLIEFLEQSNLQVFITTTESSWTPGKVIQILDGAIHDDSRISSQ